MENNENIWKLSIDFSPSQERKQEEDIEKEWCIYVVYFLVVKQKKARVVT